MLNKLVSLIVIMAMLLSVSGVALAVELPTAESGVITLADGVTYTLSADVPLGTSYIKVPSGATVILDLNGHTISGSGSGYGLVYVDPNGMLTIKATNGGAITNNNSNAIENYGTLTISGGTITGRYALYNMWSSDAVGRATINGGTFIAGDGDISVRNEGSVLTINGGSIEDTIDSDGKLEITDGTVENLALDTPSYITYKYYTDITGGTITGTIKSEDNGNTGAVHEVYIEKGTFFEDPSAYIDSEDYADVIAIISDGSNTIYVVGNDDDIIEAVKDANSSGKGNVTVTITYGTVYFYSEDGLTGVTVKTNGGIAEVNGMPVTDGTVIPEPLYDVTFNANGGTGTMVPVLVASGTDYYLPECGFIAPEGKEFDKWDAGKVGDKIIVTGDITIKALWKDKTVESKPESKPEITAGKNGKFTGKNDLSFTSNAEFTDFECVKVDGKEIAKTNYTVKSGSTIVTLNAAYLKTLTVGEHKLEIVSKTGTAETTFIVVGNAPSVSTGGGGYSGPSVWYLGGNTFGTSTSRVPTRVEIDNVPVDFVMEGGKITVSCIESDSRWITVWWGSTSVMRNFRPDGTVTCIPNGLPKTGDVSVIGYALMAVVAAAGAMLKK